MSGAESAPELARLCFVDDSRTSAYVVRRLLEPFGYRVDHFFSAEPAFVALIQKDYDLLLTDLKVSSTGMDGDDLIRTLRKSGHPKISTLPIIVITGASDAQVLVDVYDAGANQVMKKPVNADELDGHIRRLLFDGRRVKPRLIERTPKQASEGIRRRSTDGTVVTLPMARRVSRVEDTQPAPAVDVPVLKPASGASATRRRKTIPPKAPQPPLRRKKTTPVPVKRAVESSVVRSMEKAVQQRQKSGTAAAPNAAQVTTSRPAPPATSRLAKAPANRVVKKAMAPEAIKKESAAPVDRVNREVTPESVVMAHDDEPIIIESDMHADKRNTEKSYDENILQDLDQYALVETERSELFARSGIMSQLHSLVELIGFRRLMTRVLILGVALGASVVGWNMYFDQGRAVETAFVEMGEIYQSITVPGRLVSKQRVNVSAARSGRVVKILVEEGELVVQGQVLARLDDRELLSRLKRAKANMASAREGIVLAERTLNRLRKAHAKGAIARRFVEDAEVDLRAARASAGITVEEVRSATLDFDDQKITAAFAGTVTVRYVEIGQWVGPSETLFTLVDESQREIEVRVDSADSVAINIGQVVVVSSDAFPGLEWEESVMRLGAATDNQRNSNSVKVYISLGKDAPILRIGQQVDADIRTAWNPNTLKVPFEALMSREGQTMVAVLAAGRVRMKAVETGIEDFAMAEIKQGLNEGEMVILSRGMALQNGDRVNPARTGN